VCQHPLFENPPQIFPFENPEVLTFPYNHHGFVRMNPNPKKKFVFLPQNLVPKEDLIGLKFPFGRRNKGYLKWFSSYTFAPWKIYLGACLTNIHEHIQLVFFVILLYYISSRMFYIVLQFSFHSPYGNL